MGVLCALEPELGTLQELERARTVECGVVIRELEFEGRTLLATVAGVGKVHAAMGAAALHAAGARGGLLICGVCGAVSKTLQVGSLVHATSAVQADLAVRAGRELDSYPEWRRTWMALMPGVEARFLTADRPLLSAWRRWHARRTWPGNAVCDMETAAAARVAAQAGMPWACLKAVTDRADSKGMASFQHQFPTQAGRAADSIPSLLKLLPPAPAPPGPKGGSPREPRPSE